MRHPAIANLGIVLPALAPGLAIIALVLFAGESRTHERGAEMTPVDLQADAAPIAIKARPRAPMDLLTRADERSEELREQGRIESPFFAPAKDDDPSPAPTPYDEPEPKLDAHLTALMDTPRGAIAVIDGRPCRVGDRIAGDATITAIDVNQRTVTARLDYGGTVRLRLAVPGSNGFE